MTTTTKNSNKTKVSTIYYNDKCTYICMNECMYEKDKGPDTV